MPKNGKGAMLICAKNCHPIQDLPQFIPEGKSILDSWMDMLHQRVRWIILPWRFMTGRGVLQQDTPSIGWTNMALHKENGVFTQAADKCNLKQEVFL